MAAASLLTALLATGLGVVVGQYETRDESAFPHAYHDGLFPSCAGCHAPGEGNLYTVTETQCAACHDGEDMGEVSWSPPPPAPLNFLFDHELHVADLEIECAECHGDVENMDVVWYEAEACFECHGLDPEAHFAPSEGDCRTCHDRLAEEPRVTVAHLERYPMPQTHAKPGFLLEHGGLAAEYPEACATCHARESCERCHANAGRIDAIHDLERDERVAELVAGRPGSWPVPPSHTDPDWVERHGREAGTDCGSCHPGPTCGGCHQGLTRLPELPEVELAGMPELPERPRGHTRDFEKIHGPSANLQDCSICHDDSFCTDCHRDESARYHPPDFVVRHPTAAWGGGSDCADCHSTEGFCRSCHMETGLSPTRSRANGYHDAEPLWLINHGDAARQGLDACAACHQQTDCLQCHSARTGWGVNPHGPDFDAEAMRDANAVFCTMCHPRSFLR